MKFVFYLVGCSCSSVLCCNKLQKPSLNLAINMKLISKTFEKLHTLCCGPDVFLCLSVDFGVLKFTFPTLRYSGFQILVLLCLLCRVCLLIYCTIS